MKTCKKCGQKKSLGKFYKQKGNLDGRQGKCMECVKKDARDYRERNLEKCKAYDRKRGNLPHRVAARDKYRKTDEYNESHNKASRKWYSQNKEKKKANTQLKCAVDSGRLERKPCQSCGSISIRKSEAHHEDYSKPLEVIWLCTLCHGKTRRIDLNV